MSSMHETAPRHTGVPTRARVSSLPSLLPGTITGTALLLTIGSLLLPTLKRAGIATG